LYTVNTYIQHTNTMTYTAIKHNNQAQICHMDSEKAFHRVLSSKLMSTSDSTIGAI